jgi:hypothetical protein
VRHLKTILLVNCGFGFWWVGTSQQLNAALVLVAKSQLKFAPYFLLLLIDGVETSFFLEHVEELYIISLIEGKETKVQY